MRAQQVIDESRPMLEEVLCDIGLHRAGTPLNLPGLLEPFSQWAQTQELQSEDIAFLASLIGAFISEFLIERHGATRLVRSEQIFLQLAVAQGGVREFEPYAVAFEMARSRGSLSQFIHELSRSTELA